jgi:hypothetical protein
MSEKTGKILRDLGYREEKSYQKAQSIVGTNNDGGRPEHDFYPTPPEGTLGLLKKEIFAGEIWECACGDGAMVRVLEEAGYKVIGSDIEPRNGGRWLDFLMSADLLAPNIVTNPPFKFALQFAQHGLKLGATKIALLCKLAFLEGQTRGTWLEEHRPARVHVFKARLSMYRNGNSEGYEKGMLAFAWFVWLKDYTGETILDWI